MSPLNRRAAAAALIGVVAGVVPAGAARAADTGVVPVPATQPPVAPDPSAGGAAGSVPQQIPTVDISPTPPSGDQPAGAQCGQVSFTDTLPAVITCGPVTINITFTTVTTTTTDTSVSAPIVTAPISTTVTNPAPVATPANNNAGSRQTTVRCRSVRLASQKTAWERLVFKPAKRGRPIVVCAVSSR